MPEINRCLMIVKPKQPFLKWVNSLESEDNADLTLEELRNDSTAYLVPEYADDDEQAGIIEWCHKYVFEQELLAWYTTEDEWPQKRDQETFLKWFDVEFHSVVMDLDFETPLEHVDYDMESLDSMNGDPSSNGDE